MTAVSTIALAAAERARAEAEVSAMRRKAIERLNEIEAEGVCFAELRQLSDGREKTAAKAIKDEVSAARAWWADQLAALGHNAETITRLVGEYERTFFRELKRRMRAREV